ncbi:MAG TPA: DeoR/GlpR family DNA-binding transcription regulator [Candidatus Limnocylindrales bacterium]|jgi:DeoR/GlpR family transcriptional regulator of sugar metabolism
MRGVLPEAMRATTGARERRARIVELVAEQEEVEVSALAGCFGVSETSIRRDLAVLEARGRLKRVHGAAISVQVAARSTVVATKMHEHTEEKRRIGAVAASLIDPGSVVLFDSGTTIAQVPAHLSAQLRSANAFTAVTHSLLVVQEVATGEGPSLLCLGGLFLPDYQAFVGPQTVLSLKGFSADVAFVGCDGLTLEDGITTPHVLIAEVGATMAGRARRVVALADSSKLGRSGFTTIIPLSQVDLLITDVGAPPELVARIRAAGVEVILA